MAIALIASSPADNGLAGTGTTIAVTLGASVVSGDCILVAVQLRSGDGFTCTGVADSLGNTYTAQGAVYDESVNLGVMLYCFKCNVTTGGTPVVTASFDGAASLRAIHVAAFSGMNTADFDKSATGTGASGTSITSASMTPAEDNELVWGFASSNMEAPAVAGVFTLLSSDTVIQTATEYEIQTTATARTTNFTTGSSGAWATIGRTFKQAIVTKPMFRGQA